MQCEILHDMVKRLNSQQRSLTINNFVRKSGNARQKPFSFRWKNHCELYLCHSLYRP